MSDEVRLIDNRADARIAQMEAQEDFLKRLARYGLTVIPSVQEQWWPLVPANVPVVG